MASGIAGTVAGGITGFGTELAMGGNFNDALNAGVNGAIVGGTIGALAGGRAGYKQARANFVDPWTGKYQYPENGGASGEWTNKSLISGERIDRYGNEEGKYFSPEGTPLENRSLHPFSNKNYNAYEVVKPINVQSSTVAPFYGQPGGGIQYRSNLNILDLLKGGYIKPIKY